MALTSSSFCYTPGFLWLEIDENFQIVEAFGISAILRASQLCEYRFDFAEFEYACAYF